LERVPPLLSVPLPSRWKGLRTPEDGSSPPPMQEKAYPLLLLSRKIQPPFLWGGVFFFFFFFFLGIEETATSFFPPFKSLPFLFSPGEDAILWIQSPSFFSSLRQRDIRRKGSRSSLQSPEQTRSASPFFFSLPERERSYPFSSLFIDSSVLLLTKEGFSFFSPPPNRIKS